MRVYVEFAKKTFQRHAVYRVEYVFGLFNSILALFISAAIWQAVYGDTAIIDGISKNEMVTYAVLGMIMRTWLSMNEFIIDGKIHSGEIAVDLLKPYRFLRYIFAIVFGEVLFNLWTKVLPVTIIAYLAFQLVFPSQKIYIVLFLISLVFSYFVLYYLNLMFWLLSFWIQHTWSVITIKNAIVMLLSGATIPFWFLPDQVVTVLQWLPFKNIYFTPLNIFLGKVPVGDIGLLFVEQCIWIVILYAICQLLWKLAGRRLIIHGG
jgi:ABC-2 type transport system permease protein